MNAVQFLEENNFDFSVDADDIKIASKDSSVFVVPPCAVVYPRMVEELGLLVKNAPGNFTLSPRAGGTCMSGGSLTEGLIVDLKKYMHQVVIDVEKKRAIVDMGAYYRDIEHIALPHGLMFAPYTSSKDVCGIGGMIGNNASGEKSVRFGATIDNVERVWVVLSDGVEYEFGQLSPEQFQEKQGLENFEGEIYREIAHILFGSAGALRTLNRPVTKCASGYRIERIYNQKDGTVNMAKLFVGSQGTLGIITRAQLTLVPIPQHPQLLAIPVLDLLHLPEVLLTVMAHNPEGCETFDIHTYEYAKQLLPTETAAIADLMSGAHLMILAQFSEKNANATSLQAWGCMSELARKRIESHVVADPVLADNLWKIRRSSFRVMRDSHEGAHHAVPCIEDIIVPIERFDEFVPQLVKILQDRHITYGFHGHIGDGALRIIPVFDMSLPDVAQKIVELCDVTFALVNEMDGHMSADHGDGIIRTPFLEKFYGSETYGVFGAIKTLFDAENIFNPSKKIGGTVAHIEKYIIRS